MIIINGTIRVEDQSEFERVREALIARAMRSRNDSGNIDYVFSQSIEDPAEIRLIEKWETEEALNAHLQILDEEFNAVLQTAKIETAIVLSYEVTNEQVLMQR